MTNYGGKKVDVAALKLVAEKYGLDDVRDAALELEWLRNNLGRVKAGLKKKQHIIDTVNHHNNRLNNDNRACKYALGAKFMEIENLRKALEFYADEDNNRHKEAFTVGQFERMSQVAQDEGYLARKALEGDKQ